MAMTQAQDKLSQLHWFAEAFVECYPVDKMVWKAGDYVIVQLYGCALVLNKDGTWFMEDTSGG